MLSVTFYGPKIGSHFIYDFELCLGFLSARIEVAWRYSAWDFVQIVLISSAHFFEGKYHEMNYTFYVMILKICTAANN